MKIGVIVDELSLARWQADALLELVRDAQFVVYNCTNSRTAPRKLRHAGYYALRVAALASPTTRSVAVPNGLQILDTVDFESGFDGNWQTLPASFIARLRQDVPSLLVKFGMGLLRVPSDLEVPILSYHHGDPRAFRGRPAGFYELLEGRPTVGQVVQLLSNRLDSGDVVAFGETRVYPHSYRATMEEAYRCSPLLLPIAIRNLTAGTRLSIPSEGPNYRLPSNATVMRFVADRAASLVRRIGYGLWFEKAWQIAEASLEANDAARLTEAFPEPARWQVIETPKRFRFAADPFYDPGGNGLLVEALRKNSGLGEIVQIGPGSWRKLFDASGHLSYPAPLHLDGVTYVLPEMSEWSRPRLFRLTNRGLEDLGEIDIPGRPRLIDPTPLAHRGKLFLFANVASDSLSVLRLWVADRLRGPYREHPLSPIRISPAGSRMGGAITRFRDGLVRVGQDLRGNYGDGVVLFRIQELSPDAYSEEPIGELRFRAVRGPHTVNVRTGTVAFDFYQDRFSPLAGVRRIRRWLRGRSQ